MIEKQFIGDDLELITSNEPFAEMDAILKIASTDTSHPLYRNYADVKMSDFVFVNVVLTKGVPTLFYGLQQKEWMGDAARAYTRMYRPSNHRGALRDSCNILCNAGYHHLTKWWNPVTETLFVTRNVADKRDPLIHIARSQVQDRTTAIGTTAAVWNEHWKEYPYVCKINGVDQYVFIMGRQDIAFLEAYHSYPCSEQRK